MNVVHASSNPDLANSVLASALQGEGRKPGEDIPPLIPALPDTHVTLPGGLIQTDGSVQRDAEVRELTGADEEALARSGGNLARMLDTLLTRGVVAIGGEKPTKNDLERMLAGDREALILGIRRATFGDMLDSFTMTCPHCSHEQDVVINLATDVTVNSLDDPIADRTFTVSLPSGKTAHVRLPDGEAQKAVASSTDTNYGVLNTLMLSKTITEINGTPVFSPDQVRNLGIRDREAVLKSLSEHNIGPRLQEVSRSCEQCSEEVPLPLTLADLFRL